MKRKFTFGVLLLLALVARPTAAQTCALTDTSLNFGTYTGAMLNGTSTGKVTCSSTWKTFPSMPDWAQVQPKPFAR